MTKTEQARRQKANEEFLGKMDRLESEALAEIATLVRDAKRKVLRIEERLYGTSDNSFLEYVLKTGQTRNNE